MDGREGGGREEVTKDWGGKEEGSKGWEMEGKAGSGSREVEKKKGHTFLSSQLWYCQHPHLKGEGVTVRTAYGHQQLYSRTEHIR